MPIPGYDPHAMVSSSLTVLDAWSLEIVIHYHTTLSSKAYEQQADVATRSYSEPVPALH